MAHRPEELGRPEGESLVETRRRSEPPRRFHVLLHNDDYTTMEFVVEVLQRIFGHPPPEATRIMLDVHQRGVGLAGTYPKEIAETKASLVTDEAVAQGMPLLVTTEPDSGE